MTWQPISTAPKDGQNIIVLQDREVYRAKWSRDNQCWVWRTHKFRVQESHRVVELVHDGKKRRMHYPINEPWKESFDHDWTIWTKGFGKLEPTHWMPLPPAPESEGEGDGR